MDAIYIGVDFHARQQTICYLKIETGELVITELKHQDKEQVRAFYQQFQGLVIVGLEASGYSPWFETMLEQLGHQVWLGHATEIRRRARWRHKNDRRDAELIWELMVHNEFPRLQRPALESREVLRMLRYRQKLIKVRTMAKNSLQAIALQAGLAKGKQLFTRAGQEQFQNAAMSPMLQWQREHWFALLQPLQPTTVGNHGLVQSAEQRRCLYPAFADSSRHWLANGPLYPAHVATSGAVSQCAESSGLCRL